MQNKRASLNIQQEKLQSQHSIWPLLLCGSASFYFSPQSLPSNTVTFITVFIWSFLSLHIIPCFPSLFIFPPLNQRVMERKVNILSTHHRQGFYLFIMEYIRNEMLKMKYITCIVNGETISNVHILIQALKALCCATKWVKCCTQFSSLGEGVSRILKYIKSSGK